MSATESSESDVSSSSEDSFDFDESQLKREIDCQLSPVKFFSPIPDAKISIHGKGATFVKKFDSRYEVTFYNGSQITESEGNISIIDENGSNLNESNVMAKYLLDVFVNMKEQFNELERIMDCIIGRRANALCRNLADSEENVSPRSMHSSALTGTLTALKSYSGTINTDCSPCAKSSQASISSPLTNERHEILPDLKHQPLVVEHWIIAEYEDGIQMQIHIHDQDVFFLDIHTKQRLSNDQHPELMKRFHRDAARILCHALLEEVNRAK